MIHSIFDFTSILARYFVSSPSNLKTIEPSFRLIDGLLIPFNVLIFEKLFLTPQSVPS